MSGNLALNKTATSATYLAPFSPARAVDGQAKPVQRWVCTKLPDSLVVDLGQYYWIDHIILKHMGAAGWTSQYNLKGFTLAGSTDNRDWSNIITESGNTAGTNDLSFVPKPARWVRMSVSAGWGLAINPSVASLVEMEVYESSYNPYLTNLTISSGTLTPAFNQKTFEYTVEVENNVTTVTVTPTAAVAGASITVNNNPVQSGNPSGSITLADSGTTAIGIVVTNGPAQQKYTITVSKQAPAVHLTNLAMNGPRGQVVDLLPAFSPTNLTYNATADYATVTVTPTSPGNTIKVNNVPVNSGSASNPIDLIIGTNNITVEVTPAGSSAATTYTIITRRNS